MKPPDAKKLARTIWENGVVEFSGHARQEMAKDGLETTDCLNLLRAGVYGPAEHVNGQWRYRVETPRICIVVAFASEMRVRIITVWRKR